MTSPNPSERGLRIAVSGASGLIGRALTTRLEGDGHEVLRLVRRKEQRDEDALYWNAKNGEVDSLAGIDALVHLAGENIADGRWTDARKARIRDSRVEGTGLLARTIAELDSKPKVFVSASAVGYYGETHTREVDETAPKGSGFLSDVCEVWEKAAAPAREAGIRVVHPRFGVVLSPEGGALAKMLPAFRLGIGGRVGSGQQFMSWVSLEDAVRALVRLLRDPGLSGPVNVVAPEPVPNVELTRALGEVLGRPTIFPVPSFALKLALGNELASEALLGGQRVRPRILEEAGFEWRHPHIEETLRDLLEP